MLTGGYRNVIREYTLFQKPKGKLAENQFGYKFVRDPEGQANRLPECFTAEGE